jgi:acetyl-CoA acyltransferase 2
MMGIGPASTIRAALERAQLRRDQIDLIEVNEAFAAQYLAVERELGLNREQVNVNGGAIALGHRRPHHRYSHVRTPPALRPFRTRSACIGGGQGIALLIKNIRQAI